MKQVSKRMSGLVVVILAVVFAGCAAKDIRVETIDIKPPEQEDLVLPVDARAEIVVPLGAGEKKIFVGNAYRMWTLDDGQAIKNTAKEVFSKLFKELENRGEIHDPHFVIKIKSDSSIDTFWGTYKAKVQTDITYGNGQKFGTYEAEGKHGSGFINDFNALENAYRKAFLDIAKQIVNDPAKVALLKEGVNDSHVRVTDKSAIELSSKYRDLTDAVVTVIVDRADGKKGRWMDDTATLRPHGSGYFITSDGIVITNHHVVNNVTSIKVKTPGGEELDAELIAEDEWVDLALLKVNMNDTPFLKPCDETVTYSVGDEVLAIGSPLKAGLEHSISKGIVSSIRLIDGNKVIQTDAAVNPGSSGGPLIHLESQRALGIITLGVLGAEGIGFAIPAETVSGFLEKNQALLEEEADPAAK